MWDIEGAVHYTETCKTCKHSNTYLLSDVQKVEIAMTQSTKYYINCHWCGTPITITKHTLYVEDNRNQPRPTEDTLQR